MLKFNPIYFTLTIALFITEILIALFVHDRFIRPYLGDVLVVILLYWFVQSFFNLRVKTAAFSVLAFAFIIEFLQFLNIVEKLSLEKSKLARTVIGTSFSWIDLLTYAIGIAIVFTAEKYRQKQSEIQRNHP